MCSHSEAVAVGRYFTMSPSGVTSYSADGSRPQFLSLTQWQREYQLHMRLVQKRVFKQHRWVWGHMSSKAAPTAVADQAAAFIHAGRLHIWIHWLHSICCALYLTLQHPCGRVAAP